MTNRTHLNYLKDRYGRFKDQVIRLLGSRCERCNNPEADRIEFRDMACPLRKQFSANKVSLFRKVLDGEYHSSNLKLLCDDCYLTNRSEWKEALGTN